MRVAALYDIHGNLPALEAVLQEVHAEGIAQIVVGGDVLPGPMPRETLDCLLDQDIPTQFILGNGDREVLAQMTGVETDWFRAAKEEWRAPVRWTAQQLYDEHRVALETWQQTCQLEFPGLGSVLFCHATPQSDTPVFTRLTDEAKLISIFEGIDASTVVCGHTHMQFDRMVGKTRVVNAGSVGMPYGEPGAYWLLIGPDVKLRRTDYDQENAAKQIRSTGFPNSLDFATRNIMQPLNEKAMLAAFAPIELS